MPSKASSAAATSSGSKASGRKLRTPIVLQMHASECGAACLGMVLGCFGRWVPLTELREQCKVSRDGSTAASIARAAKYYGLECKGRNLRVDLLPKLDPPLILFWQFSHFLVLEGIEGDKYYLNDPATGRRTITKEEFENNYSGIALQFKPESDFKAGGKPPSLFSQLGKLLDGSWRVLSGVVACALMLALLMLVLPASLQIFIDNILGNYGPWSGLVAALLGGGVLSYILSLLKQRFLRRLKVKISVTGYNRSLSRLLRLPLEFFQHRLVGDLTDRVSSIDRIARNLTDQFLVLVIDIALSAILLIAMFVYNALLALTVLGLALLYASLAYFLNRRRIAQSYTMRREQGLLIGMGMQMLSHADILRMTGSDDRSFARWSGQQARELHARRINSELGSVNSAMPYMFDIFCCAAVLGVGGSLLLAEQITLGTLVGFFILTQLFLTPVGRFVEFTDRRQTLATDLQRLDDIYNTAEDPVFSRRNAQPDSVRTFKGRLQLTGRLELKNITFGYNRARPPLIKDFNLVIEPGQRVAVVGPSGSGKSTLARLVSGACKPWSGEILFDGHTRLEIPEEVMNQSLSMVDQEVVLFSASLRDNLTLWNSAIPDEIIFDATRDAQIHSEILLRPQGYATQVEEGGANFSGGQRQRLEIARALVGNPSLLILDEATSALDATTEEYVDNAIRRRGITCLIVAHRLSTVRDCDEIIVIVQGSVVQRGTHDELIADRDGAYYKLVKLG